MKDGSIFIYINNNNQVARFFKNKAIDEDIF